MRPLLLALLFSLPAVECGAQVIRRGSFGAAPPAAWASGGIGLTQGWSVTDGGTGSRWDFGSATQYEAALEKSLGGVSVGLRGTTALVPLRYTGRSTSGTAIATDADAHVSQLFGTVHLAGGQGFHSVLELDAGATLYSNFRARGTDETLAPSSDTDFTFAFGYGFGVGLSNRFTIEVVQELATIVHQRDGLAASDDANVRVNSTRIVGRFGLGSRR